MLVEIFGNYPQIKVLDYLLMNPFGKYTKQQIAVGSEISRITLNNFIGEIIEKDILIKDNDSRFYLNLHSPIVKILNRSLDEFNKIEMERQMKNSDEPYDVLSDDELDIIFDENAPDVDLDKLEQEISLKEKSTLHIEYLDEHFNDFKLSFANI